MAKGVAVPGGYRNMRTHRTYARREGEPVTVADGIVSVPMQPDRIEDRDRPHVLKIPQARLAALIRELQASQDIG